MTDLEKSKFNELIYELKRISIVINNDYSHLIEEDEEMSKYIGYLDAQFEAIAKIKT